MMLPTHALGGMLLALPLALAVPEFGPVALLAGFLGGVFPDLDMYVGHRKTLHYPVYFSAFGAVAALTALLVPTGVTVALALFLIAAAVHSVADAFGGGLELRPWEATSERAVYDHYHGRWIAPRRWVGYDGSPGDLALSLLFAAPLLLVLDGHLQWLVAGSAGIAVAYAAVRRHLPTIAERLVALVPPWVWTHLPERYWRGEITRSVTVSTDD